VNTLLSDNKTEREVERKRVGLSFLIVNLGVPWALRTNSPVFSWSCPKRVLFFFFEGNCHRALHSEVKVSRNGPARRSSKRIVAGTAFRLEFQVH